MASEQPNEASIFNSARKIESTEQRDVFVSRACGGDSALRERVEKLLAAYAEESQYLEQPAPGLEETMLTDSAGASLAASLDAGLAPAFGEDAAVVIGEANHSVLRALGNTLDEVPCVSLRESEAEWNDRVTRPSSPEVPSHPAGSRYRLDGEIARGGMGAIIKGRDTDLGRDLAIKVLLDSHKDKPEVVQRFIEEAQIGGQLQHPGIAPVYELGQFADQRPFFSMKLVKGQTLSKLLADRENAADDRGKFIGIFEQVCQTMAYAHSRGVIHRDLKPANIMVGLFGEVQVMDWGLAKVLPVGGVADEKKSHHKSQGQSIIQTLRSVGSGIPGAVGTVGSETQMGSVMGTPAYMPPEQALGEIDQMDERADVFGLGAILCEILTGQPPYVGDDVTQIFRLASRGKLNACFERLDVCGADAELIALAKHCLELEPADRPRDAGALAERMTGYLESVESKLRETEMERAAQEARAEAESLKAQAESARAAAESARAQEENRRRRTSLALAGSVLLLVGLGSGGWLYMERQEARRLADEALAQSKHATEMGVLAEQRDDQRRVAEKAEKEALAAAEAVKDSLYHSILSDARATRLLRSEGFREHVFERLSVARDLNTKDQNIEKLRQEAIACLGDFVGESPITHTKLSYVIRGLALHPNGVEAALTVDDGSMRIINIETAKELQRLQFSLPLVDVWYSPNGQQLLAASPESRTMIVFGKQDDREWEERTRYQYTGNRPTLACEVGTIALLAGVKSVAIHNVADGSMIKSLEIAHDPAAMGIGADGRRLITGYFDRSRGTNYLNLWDVESGRLIAETDIPFGMVHKITISPDGNFVGVGCENGLALHELPSLQRRFHVQEDPVRTVAISPDNQFVAFGTREKRALLWSINASQEVASFRCADRHRPQSIEFDDTGSRFVVASGESIRMWNLKSADERLVVGGHKGGISSVAFSADGKTFASCGKDRAVKVWDADTGALLESLTGFDSPVQTLAFHPTSGLLVTGEFGSGVIQFWDLLSQQSIATLSTTNRQVWKVAFTADGAHLATMGLDGLEIWRVSYDADASPHNRLGFQPVVRRDCSGRDICFSPDGKYAAFDDERTVRVWDLQADREIPFVAPPLLDGIHSLGFLPDSRHLVFVTAKGGIQAWEVSTGQRSLVIGKADDFAQGYSAITNNGRLLATGKPAGIVTIWDVENLQRWFELPEATSGVWSVAWSPNGQMLAVGQSDGGLSVWRLPQIRNALQSIDLDWTFEQPKPAADKLTLAPSNMNQPSVDEVLIWRRRITGLLQRRRDYRIRAEFGLQFIDAKPEDSMRWLTVAPALVLAGDDAGYAAFCARATSQFSGTQVPIIAENAIKAVLLKANAVDLGKLPAKQFTSSLEGGTVPDLFRPWFWGTRALLAYRSGDAESAVKYIAKSNEHQPKDVARALNLAVLAMAQHQLKDHDKALLALKASSRLITRLNGAQKASHDLLIAEILFREATALLENEESPSASK